MPSASIVSIIGIVVSASVSAYSGARQADSQEDQLKYAAKVARDQAAQEEAAVRRKTQVEVGRERAVLGKLGILPTAGSPLEQLARNAGEAERSAVLARQGLLQEASLYDLSASSVSSQKGLVAASNVLTGLGSAYSQASPLLTKRPQRTGTSTGSPGFSTRGLA